MTDLSYIVDGLRPLAVSIDTLHEDPANARKHNAKNLAAIRASFEQYGQVKPIAARRSDMVVLAGNGRLRVAKELGWTHMAVVLMDGTEEQLRAFALLDNRSAELAEWDEAALSELVSGLAAEEVDLSSMGFRQEELDRLVDIEEVLAPELPTVDELPDEPKPAKPVAPTKPQAKKVKKTATALPAGEVLILTAEERAVLDEAAAAIRLEREDPDMALGEVIRRLARRYLKSREG